MRLTVRVPATCANLGPGFDCLGLALRLYNEVTLDTEAEPGISWEGEGADELPTDGSDMVSTAIRKMGALHDTESPPYHLHGVNAIPLERGLGSSSAAAVAGVSLGYRLFGLGEPGPLSVFSQAAEIEGHPDNAAPCVFGGFTIASPPGDEEPVRLDPHPSLRPVALIPEIRLPTAEARAALPSEVALGDAVANIRRTALAVVAFTRDPDLLRTALFDRLHQDARLGLVPQMRGVFDRLRDAGVPVCVSGAGPTLMAFPTDGARVLPDPGPGWTVLPLEPDRDGAFLRVDG